MSKNRQKKLIALKKARSLIDKIITMIEEERYCIDIMQQNLAVVGLLRSTHQTLMEDHINHCFIEAIRAKDEKRRKEMVLEILSVSNLFNR